MRVKTLANRGNWLNTQRLEYIIELFTDQLNTMEKMPEFFRFSRLNASFVLEGAREVIYYRQQLARDVGNNTAVGLTAFAFDSLAIVFEVRLSARQTFRGLGQRRVQSFQFRAGGHEFREVRATKIGFVNGV